MRRNLIFDENAVVEVTKEVLFDSCHKLYDYIGKCSRLHGHTYKLQLTIKGTVDDLGMVLDFNTLKHILNNEVVEELDHYNLNDKFDFNTTAENMVVYLYYALNKSLALKTNGDRPLEVVKVRLWETPTSYATFRGEEV